MVDAAKTPNVVEACNKPGLYETLEDTQRRYIAQPCLHVWCLAPSFLDHLIKSAHVNLGLNLDQYMYINVYSLSTNLQTGCM